LIAVKFSFVEATKKKIKNLPLISVETKIKI